MEGLLLVVVIVVVVVDFGVRGRKEGAIGREVRVKKKEKFK
jgi:hypothetical protein